MTKRINRDFKNLTGVAHNDNPLSFGKGSRETIEFHRNSQHPSPQRGRGAGGEGDRHAVVGCLPFPIQPASPVFIAKSLLRSRPLSPSQGAREVEFSILSQLQGRQRGLSARSKKLGARILVACLWILFFAATPRVLAQVKKADKPTEQPASTKPQATAERPQLVQKVFAIKHADVDAIARTLNIFPVPVQPNRELRVIGVSAPAALMSTIEETIRRFDVPPPAPKNVELTVYLLLASDQETSEGSAPSDLENVVKQLRATFAFKGFRTIDTLVVRSRDKQSAEVRGLARLDPEIPNPSTYSFSHKAASIVSDEKGRSIRLDGLRFNAHIVSTKQKVEGGALVEYETYNAGFGTDVDVREGQKVVVGQAAIGGTNNALILVITAKVLE